MVHESLDSASPLHSGRNEDFAWSVQICPLRGYVTRTGARLMFARRADLD